MLMTMEGWGGGGGGGGGGGRPYVKSTDEYIYKYTIVKVKVYVFP